MITPPENWHRIQGDLERLEVCKKYKLVAPTKTEFKDIYYKGIYTDEPVVCKVVGYADTLLVIEVNGELHSIHPDYLLQMQKKDFCLSGEEQQESNEILPNFIAIDFETANKHQDPCALGITIIKNGKIFTQEKYLINPKARFHQDCIDVHGITEKDVCNCNTFDVVWEKIKSYFEEIPFVVAHNVAFDGGVLVSVAERYHIQLPALTYYCTMELSQKNYDKLIKSGALSGYGLSALCDYFKIPLQHHSCDSDSFAAAQIMLNLLSDKSSKIEPYKKRIIPFRFEKEKTGRKPSTFLRLIDPHIQYDSTEIVFQGKTFVITGTVSTNHDDKMYYENLIQQLGGVVKKTVSHKVDYLIVGLQDPTVVKDKTGKSTNILKAEEYRKNGMLISIISRHDFLESLKDMNLLASEDVVS